MDDNVRRKVKELAEALVASEEYRKLRDARDEIDRAVSREPDAIGKLRDKWQRPD